MFREEQPLLYIYKVTEETENHPLKGELFNSKKADLNDGVTLIGKYRHAFVGNMQEWLDKIYQRDNMREYAENVKPCSNYFEKAYIGDIKKKEFLFLRIKKLFHRKRYIPIDWSKLTLYEVLRDDKYWDLNK